MKFDDLGFEPQLQEGLEMMGFNSPTPIQEKAIPIILNNKDLVREDRTQSTLLRRHLRLGVLPEKRIQRRSNLA